MDSTIAGLTMPCPNCKNEILKNSNFCQFCGYKLNEKITLSRQFYIYAVSLLLPPLGLIWFFKYFRSSEVNKKNIAYITLILTILSTFLTIWWTISFIKSFQNSFSQYSSLGY